MAVFSDGAQRASEVRLCGNGQFRAEADYRGLQGQLNVEPENVVNRINRAGDGNRSGHYSGGADLLRGKSDGRWIYG